MRLFVVIDDLITDENSWETHLSSMLQGYVEATNTDCAIIEVHDSETIKAYFQTGFVEIGDKFIFPNAWTPMTIYVKHWAENYDLPVELIGFWSRGCYINQDPIYRPMNNRDWRKVHERASFRCLDKSYFISEYHKEQFRIYISKNVFPDRLTVSAFPLDYLNLELESFKSAVYKQDIITFPWHKYTDLHEQIMYDFIRVFSGEISVVFAQEKSNLPRFQLMNQLAKSKVAFLPYNHPNLGKEIYECLILGTIPLVPDIEGVKDFVPEEFTYPPEWTENIFNYSRSAPDLTAKIRNLTKNYRDYVPLIDEYKDYLYEHHFDSEKIITQLFENYKRN